MGTQLVIDVVVVAFAEQVQIELAQLRRKEIRIVLGECDAVSIANAQPVRLQRPASRHLPFEETRVVDTAQGSGNLAPVGPFHRDFDRVGLKHAHDAARLGLATSHLVIAEHRARLRMTRLDQCTDVRGGQLEFARHRFSLAGHGSSRAQDEPPRGCPARDSPEAEEPPPDDTDRHPDEETCARCDQADAPPGPLRDVTGAEVDWSGGSSIVRQAGHQVGCIRK